MAFVHLQYVAALEFFRADLARFRTGVDASLSAVSGQLNQSLNFVGGRVLYWKRQYDAWHAEAERLQGELRRCEAMTDGRCDDLYEQYLQARTLEALAQANHKEANFLFEMVKEAGTEFERERRRTQGTLMRVEPLAAAALIGIAARARRVHAAPLLGTVLAQAGTIFAARGRASPTGQGGAGTHAPRSGEGETRESEATPESREGGARITGAPSAREKDKEPEFSRSIEGGW